LPVVIHINQNIQVKNRRLRVDSTEVEEFIRTTAIARQRWKIDIRTAVVAVRTQAKAASKLIKEHIPIVYSINIYAPEKYRSMYEELNTKLAYGFIITDKVSSNEPLYQNIAKYILKHEYKNPI
jgi:hypothetical protein